jgi:hypothetical protein
VQIEPVSSMPIEAILTRQFSPNSKSQISSQLPIAALQKRKATQTYGIKTSDYRISKNTYVTNRLANNTHENWEEEYLSDDYESYRLIRYITVIKVCLGVFLLTALIAVGVLLSMPGCG